MIKALKKYEIMLTPFTVAQTWNLNNTENTNLLLYESTGSDDGFALALEFIDYGNNQQEFPIDNYECDIALEQQPYNLATVEQGLNVQGLFYPNLDPQNPDGTYQRTIYHQVATTFYNTYFDPTKIWGLEDIDFELSQTKRLLSDLFQLIDIPTEVFGTKILPGSVTVYQTNLDNPYVITDDGNNNLIAGPNVFTKQQELGNFPNTFNANLTNSYCNYYWVPQIPATVADTGSLTTGFFGGQILNWLNIDSASMTVGLAYGIAQNITVPGDTASLAIGFYNGATFLQPPLLDSPFDSALTTGFVSGSVPGSVIVITGSDSPIIDSPDVVTSFYSATITNTITTITGSDSPIDTNINTTAFFTASVTQSILTVSGSDTPDTGSLTTAFYTGSQITTIIPLQEFYNTASLLTGFVSGNIA